LDIYVLQGSVAKQQVWCTCCWVANFLQTSLVKKNWKVV